VLLHLPFYLLNNVHPFVFIDQSSQQYQPAAEKNFRFHKALELLIATDQACKHNIKKLLVPALMG